MNENSTLHEPPLYENNVLMRWKFFIIPPELRQIPSLPLIQTIQFNCKGYISREPLLHNYLMEPLNKQGILKYFDILPGKWIIVVSNPELTKELFQRTDAFQKSDQYAYLGHRRVSNPAFSHSWPPELFGNLAIEFFEVMNKTDEKSPTLDVFHLLRDALGLAAFGYNFGIIRKSGSELEKAYLMAVDRMSDRKDLLYYMLKAEETQDNLKSRLTTEELLNDMKVFLVAGHDTTAIALAAAIYFLGINQECQEKSREEAIRIMGDEKKNIIFWEESYKFRPERFAKEKDTANKHLPFDSGNRICVGMNFSYAE
ncbi:hypothetical protein Glove_396g55 [Diversispora epigaea]|uniref:Cytochrome P450 n=1 Tax=Diversispora epigaea TaxID=1348612 RepID=A0A397H1H0_9GLOM|nr:hypothetical protein Glove_396g55 [Diversispora epigaea]